MNKERLQNALPALVMYGGAIAGAAGMADTVANVKYGVDLGLRGLLPEPIDFADHGMSWAVGAHLSSVAFQTVMGRRQDQVSTAENTDDPSDVREWAVGRLRQAARTALWVGILAGASYMIASEGGSEATHWYRDRQQAAVPEAEKRSIPLGHFDALDLLYGVGAAGAIATLKARQCHKDLDVVVATIESVTVEQAGD